MANCHNFSQCNIIFWYNPSVFALVNSQKFSSLFLDSFASHMPFIFTYTYLFISTIFNNVVTYSLTQSLLLPNSLIDYLTHLSICLSLSIFPFLCLFLYLCVCVSLTVTYTHPFTHCYSLSRMHKYLIVLNCTYFIGSFTEVLAAYIWCLVNDQVDTRWCE